MANTSGMRVTTVRFGEDLWATITDEAAKVGISASQFIREAALARAAAAAGSRGEMPFAAQGDRTLREVEDAAESLPDHERRELQRALAVVWRTLAAGTRDDSEALRGESAQARLQAQRHLETSELRLHNETDT